MTNKKSEFPRQVYATLDTDCDPPLLLTDFTSERAEDGERVAIYELKEIKIKKVTHDLVTLR